MTRRSSFMLPMMLAAVPLLIAVCGVVWEDAMIARFRERHGSDALFQTWVGKDPHDYTYDYRGANRHYERWAMRVPWSVTVATIVLYSAAAAYRHRRHREAGFVVAAVWVASMVAIVGFTIRTLERWIAYSGVFI